MVNQELQIANCELKIAAGKDLASRAASGVGCIQFAICNW
jgi:hypothetical protein